MSNPFRVAVIGAGNMGQHHVSRWREIDGMELVAIADCNDAILNQFEDGKTTLYNSYLDMITSHCLDAVSVCVPTALHHDVVLDCLRAGCHVLVEKPIAHDSAAAADMIAAAKRAGRVLAVGHIERYNPAMSITKRLIDDGAIGKILSVSIRRWGPAPERLPECGIVKDLAIHDLDLLRWIFPNVIRKTTYCLCHEDSIFCISGEIRRIGFVGEISTNLHVSYHTDKVRTWGIIGVSGKIQTDLLTKQVRHTDATGAITIHDGSGDVDQLTMELSEFMAACQGEAASIVTGADGAAALRWAERLEAFAREEKGGV